MNFSPLQKWLLIPSALAAILGWKYLLPVALPFLLSCVLALAAEPLVSLTERRFGWKRGVSTALGVTVALVLLSCLFLLAAAGILRQLTRLAGAIPDLTQTAKKGLTTAEGFLRDLSAHAPQSLRPVLDRTVTGLFTDSDALLSSLTSRIPGALSSVFGYVTGSALTVGTGIFGGYMISARLPKLRQKLSDPETLPGKLLPKFRRVGKALGGWLKAQLKLSGVSFLILLAGFLLLRIKNAPVLALVTALVDAVPLLGTGTVLIPWAIVSLLQEKALQAVGLLGLYAIAALTRSALEPRLVGRQLGLDPLVTLIALYAGWRFWGFGGMLAAPLLCVVVKEASAP